MHPGAAINVDRIETYAGKCHPKPGRQNIHQPGNHQERRYRWQQHQRQQYQWFEE